MRVDTNTNMLLFTKSAREKLEQDYQAWLAKGNKPQVLPMGATSEEQPDEFKKPGRGKRIDIARKPNAG